MRPDAPSAFSSRSNFFRSHLWSWFVAAQRAVGGFPVRPKLRLLAYLSGFQGHPVLSGDLAIRSVWESFGRARSSTPPQRSCSRSECRWFWRSDRLSRMLAVRPEQRRDQRRGGLLLATAKQARQPASSSTSPPRSLMATASCPESDRLPLNPAGSPRLGEIPACSRFAERVARHAEYHRLRLGQSAFGSVGGLRDGR